MPDVLLSGNHEPISGGGESGRRCARTLERRPDLLPTAELDNEEREILRALMDEKGADHGRD